MRKNTNTYTWLISNNCNKASKQVGENKRIDCKISFKGENVYQLHGLKF